ncbi:MAG: integrase core domain-containing protein [Prevotella sp.]|nr:integrase core domain-containing protein [Prevotella sp.]
MRFSKFQKRCSSFEHAYRVIERYIHFYNYRRPHMSIGYKIPAVVHLEQGEQKKMWKNKIYPKKQTEDENKTVSLPSRTNSPGDGVCLRT